MRKESTDKDLFECWWKSGPTKTGAKRHYKACWEAALVSHDKGDDIPGVEECEPINDAENEGAPSVDGD